MSDFEIRREQAQSACEKVINGIEDGAISASSAMLICKKIARLVNDEEGQEWLDYEYGGYPLTKDGHIQQNAWKIARNHGRGYIEKKKDGCKEYIFTELCGELEMQIEGDISAINNYSTQGFSVSGEWAAVATSRLTSDVSNATNGLRYSIKKAERYLTILKSQYYNYALKWQIELSFGKTIKSIFEEYREQVENYHSMLPETAIRKLKSIEEIMLDNNPESYAQVLTSCRRLWSETAKYLFDLILPEYKEDKFETKSGKKIDITGDHDNNRLSAVIETIESKATKNTLVGSEIVYLIDWIEQINKRQNAGVHSEVTRKEAIKCIIHTYIALGDILSSIEDINKAVD